MNPFQFIFCTLRSPFINFISRVYWWPLLLCTYVTVDEFKHKTTRSMCTHCQRHIFFSYFHFFFQVKKRNTYQKASTKFDSLIWKIFLSTFVWSHQNMCFVLSFIYYSEYVTPMHSIFLILDYLCTCKHTCMQETDHFRLMQHFEI